MTEYCARDNPRKSAQTTITTTTTTATTITGRLTTDVPTCAQESLHLHLLPHLLLLLLSLASCLISGFLDRLTEARIKLRSKDTAGHLVTMIFAARAITNSGPASDYRRMG